MKTNLLLLLALMITIHSCNSSAEQPSAEGEKLEEGFLNPPLDARPKALWCWVDGNFNINEITREMETAKEKGMGGFDIWDVWHVVDETDMMPEGPAFMSDPYVEGIAHAIEEATRLDLELGVIISSGWNAGGSWVKPEHATMGLFRSSTIANGPGSFNQKLEFPELPEEYGRLGPALIQRDENGLPVFYKDIAVIAVPADAENVELNRVIDLTEKMNSDGILNWEVPEGEWKITRYVCTNTGQPMIAHTPNSTGPMLDHFNPEATKAHIDFFANKLLEKVGTFENKGLRYFYTDSYEVRGDLWTPEMRDEFRKRAGYDLLPYLPVLEGKTIGNEDVTQRFLFDYKKVLSDLIIEGHYAKASEVCKDYGLLFAAEAGGPGPPVHNCPFESVKSSGSVDIPRGEFWHRRQDRPGRGSDMVQIIKGVSSATHLYDRKYVEAEAFTSTQLWQESPADLKPTVDRFFCEGLNRIVFHTWAHTPPEAGLPGWCYAFGTQVGETRIWWPKAKAFMDYLSRCSYLLQEGNFMGDVLYYYGDKAPNFPGVKKIDPSLGFGFDYDVTNTEILLQLEVKDGKLTLPHGQEYEILVLPDEDKMNPEVAEKLIELVQEGATVVGRKPAQSYSLHNYEENDKKVRELANELWEAVDSITVQERDFGDGKIIWGKPLRTVLREKGVGPDLALSENVDSTDIDFIHRRAGDADVYFVRNKKDTAVQFDALFRVEGKMPEIWDPYSGEIYKQQVFAEEEGAVRVPVKFGPYGSQFFVFRKPVTGEYFNKVIQEGNQLFPNHSGYQKEENKTVRYVSRKGEEVELTPGGFQPEEIKGPWKVMFTDPWGTSFSKTFDELLSWPEHDEHDVKYFSGLARYENTFELSGKAEERLVVINLGEVKELADLYINGEQVAILWNAPFVADITKYVKPGTNTVAVEVANLWPNRMIGDYQLPPAQRKVKSNVVRMPNGWSIPLGQLPNEEYGLLPSGLLGPVTVEYEIEYFN